MSSALVPFQPKGDKALWRIGYENIVSAGISPGKFFPHEVLAGLLTLSLSDYARNRSPLYSIVKAMEREHGVTLVSVHGHGYRVSYPNEHAEIAEHRKRKGRKQTQAAIRLIDGTDRTALTPTEADRLINVERACVIALHSLSIHEQRLNQHEAALRRAGLL